MQTNLLTSACMQGILMSLVANPINFASISVSGPLQIVILIYWPCVQKNGGSNYIWLPSPLRWRWRYFFWWFGEVRSTENTIEGDHGKSSASAACKPRQPPYLHLGSPLNQRTGKCTSSTSTFTRPLVQGTSWMQTRRLFRPAGGTCKRLTMVSLNGVLHRTHFAKPQRSYRQRHRNGEGSQI